MSGSPMGRRRPEPWLHASLAVLSMAGCPLEDTEPECPAWTRVKGGRCTLRPWVVPRSDEGFGEPGARDVQVAVGDGGEPLLAWTRATAEEGYVVIAEPQGTEWSTTEVRMDSGIGLEPAIALRADGAALLTWKQQRTDGAIYLATRDRVGSWRWPSEDQPLSWSETAYEPRARFGPEGEAFVLWNQWTGENFGVALGTRAPGDAHGAFVTPARREELLSPPVNFANAPRIAVSTTGEVLVTWYQAPVDDLMVYISERRGPGEPFSRPSAGEFLSPAHGPVDSHAHANPWPALHESGAAAVVWTQQIEEQSIRVFLATRDPDGTWHSPANPSDSLSPASARARCPQAAFDPEGTLMVTWFQTIGSDTGVFAWRGQPGEGTDTAEPMRLSSDGAQAVHPSLAVGPDGGAVVVWSEQAGESWWVAARRHEPREDRWFDTERLSEPREGLAPEPRVAVEAREGQVVAAWAEGSVLDGRVFVASLP